MTTVNTQTQTLIAPTTRPGFFGRLMRWFCGTRMESAMYRIAPTRKM